MTGETTSKDYKRSILLYGDGIGRVDYIDHIGDERRILNAARVSFGKHSDDPNLSPQDHKLLRYLIDHRHTCYDPHTEVLTSDGWVKWPDVKEKHLLGVWNPEQESLVYEKPKRLVASNFDGEMYRVEHGGVDLLVTPNHKMWVSQRKQTKGEDGKWRPIFQDFGLVSAKDLGNRSMIRYSKLAPHLHAARIDTDFYALLQSSCSPEDVCRFLGFFIGDGYAGGSDKACVTFHLKKERKVSYLLSLCEALNLEVIERANNTYAVRFLWDAIVMRKHFYGKDRRKRIPAMLSLSMNKFESLAFMDGLKNSDGHSPSRYKNRESWIFCTAYSSVADEAQRIALHAGLSCNLNVQQSGMFSMHICSRMNYPVINQTSNNTSSVRYVGNVYCAETSTGVLVVRRNGKVVLSGNSTLEHNIYTFRFVVPLFVRGQHHRHRMWSYNEISRRYTEFDLEFYEPEGFRVQHKSNKQASTMEWFDPAILSLGGGQASELLKEHTKRSMEFFEALLEQGVAREMARMVLPQNMYVQYWGTCDLNNLVKFLELRIKPDAQWEIRRVAWAILLMLNDLLPQTLGPMLMDRFGEHVEGWIPDDAPSEKVDASDDVVFVSEVEQKKELSDGEKQAISRVETSGKSFLGRVVEAFRRLFGQLFKA